MQASMQIADAWGFCKPHRLKQHMACRESRTTSFALSTALLAVLCSLSSSLYQVSAATPACYPSLPNCVALSPSASLAWNVSDDGFITFAMTVEGAQWGWLGLGISEGGMKGADMAIIHLQGDHPKAEDRWSVQEMMPVLDKQQDVQLMHSEQSGGRTLAVFRRPLVTCDDQDTPVLFDSQQNLVFAYGVAWGYHGIENRGSYSLMLWPNATAMAAASAAAAAVAGPSGPPLMNFTMTMNSYAIPVDPTTYACINFALPSVVKHHIYYYEPVVTSRLVHHMVGYACRGEPTNVPLGTAYNCLRTMPNECSLFYFLWAPGSGRVNTPPEAGLPFGLGSFEYLTLQIHYTNMGEEPGQVDSSGYVLHYSPVLKKYDLGMLTLGSMSINVPPGLPSFALTPNVCPSSCTEKFPQPVTLVQSFLHMHQIGSKIQTQHIRDGVELEPLGRRDYYSFDFQAMSSVPTDSRQLLPGDTLITTCTYDSMERSANTTFGPSSYDEMCYNFLAYYPAVDFIDACISIDSAGLAICATQQQLESNLTSQEKVQARYLVRPGTLSYTPYEPNCTASASLAAASSPEPGRHHRSAGGTAAITVILIILAVAAAVAVTAGVKRHLHRRKLGMYGLPADQALGMSHGGNFGGSSGGHFGVTQDADKAAGGTFSPLAGGGGGVSYAAAGSDAEVHGRAVGGVAYDGRGTQRSAEAGPVMEAGLGRVHLGQKQEKQGLLR